MIFDLLGHFSCFGGEPWRRSGAKKRPKIGGTRRKTQPSSPKHQYLAISRRQFWTPRVDFWTPPGVPQTGLRARVKAKTRPGTKVRKNLVGAVKHLHLTRSIDPLQTIFRPRVPDFFEFSGSGRPDPRTRPDPKKHVFDPMLRGVPVRPIGLTEVSGTS